MTKRQKKTVLQYPVLARLRADSALMMMSRDHFSCNEFITPVVVNGKVYVGMPSSVAAFGLLP